MVGKEEAVAKAAVLEILRLAEEEKRHCHLFFFSGFNQVEELEVPPAPIPAKSWQCVLDFLGSSFQGGTDLEAPLTASVLRLQGYQSVWQLADILLITDSKIEQPSAALQMKLKALRHEGLRLFALIVVQEASMSGIKYLTRICDEVRCFEALGRVSFGLG